MKLKLGDFFKWAVQLSKWKEKRTKLQASVKEENEALCVFCPWAFTLSTQAYVQSMRYCYEGRMVATRHAANPDVWETSSHQC